MYYIALWDLFELRQITHTQQVVVRDDLRGYNFMFPADLRAEPISVSLLATSYCPVDRNVYIERVLGAAGRTTEEWPRVAGREIHRLLQQLHAFLQQYVADFASQHRSLRNLDVCGALTAFSNQYIGEVREGLLASGYHPGGEVNSLVLHLQQIAAFEAITAAALLNYHIAATGMGARSLRQTMDTVFDFRAIEQELHARWLGLTEPVTPDFLYRRRIIGDIKTGEVDAGPGGMFELCCTAYAMAWEQEYREPIDWGIILHVSHDRHRRKNVPIYKDSQIFPLDTTARLRLLEKLEQKLRLIRDGQDPGYPGDREGCRDCVYEAVCYADGENA